jgi:transposase-like protein
MQILAKWVVQLTKGRWQVVPAHTVETLRSEIDRLEKNLRTPPAQRSINKAKLAELQKFMDLAG